MESTDPPRGPCADDLFEPRGLHPYYIAAPTYTETSAGIRVLHLLAQALVRRGMLAYVADLQRGVVANRAFSGPVAVPTLTAAIVREHHSRGLSPIAVYPETMSGNALGAATVVRYFLNYPGVLGGQREFPSTDLRLAFSQAVADASGAEMVLCLPTSDPRVFRPDTNAERDLVLAYAAKFRKAGGEPALPLGAVEITSNSPRRGELPGLLTRGSELHVWEDTALIIEALLSGCPVVLRPEAGLKNCLMHHELGSAGIARSSEREALDNARSELGTFRARYDRVIERAWVALDHFVSVTQDAADKVTASTVNVRALRGRSRVVPVGPTAAAAYQLSLDARSQLHKIYCAMRRTRHGAPL